jgi:DHA1 family bicyclomycin/chloramphenicol resistance-like MFS transporter
LKFSEVTRKQQTILILMLGALSTVSPFAIDMYLPAFPAMAADLDTDITNIQLSLTSYFIGISAGQLLYGPLLDRFGRKPPLYIGLIVYIIASAACAFAGSANALIATRFIQALGGCAGMVAAQTLVRDLFPVEKTASAFSWMILVVAVSPMVAPTFGGYVTTAWGWQSVFISLAVVATVMLVGAYFILPAGRKADPTISLRPADVVRNFYGVLREPQFLIYCVAGGLAGAAPFAFISGSADAFINYYGLSEKEYGWIFALVGATIIGGAQINHLLLRYFSSEKIVLSAITYQLIVGLIILAILLITDVNFVGVTVASTAFLFVHGLSNANSSALALAPFSRFAGSAASILGTFRMAAGAIVSALVSVLHNGTIFPMMGVMIFCAAGGFLILVSGRVVVKYRATRDATEETSVTI